jgi:hypothetical protein
VEYIKGVPAGRTIIAKPVKLFNIDEKGSEQQTETARDWETVIGSLKEKNIPGLDAEGQMTDAALERISRLEHVTSLKLGGSTRLTDEGLLHLARMPPVARSRLERVGYGSPTAGLSAAPPARTSKISDVLAAASH